MIINDPRVPGILVFLRLVALVVWAGILVGAVVGFVFDYQLGRTGLLILVYPVLVVVAARELWQLVHL